MQYQQIVDAVHAKIAPLIGCGRVADYIPGLAGVDPRRFGLALAAPDGAVYGAGDWQTAFSIQSVSKVFSLALVLGHDSDAIWRRIGREPSGSPFNSLHQLEQDRGVPRNPFVNAGALVVVDELLTLTGDPSLAVLDLLRAEAGNPAVTIDEQVAKSEAGHRHRNAALAHLVASYGNLTNPVDAVLDQYTAQCAIAMNCGDLARAAGFLARHGLRTGGSRLLSRSDAKRLNATMLTCGTYDSAGEFAYRVGLPAKSGVGGGILAVVPNRCTLAVWGPGLDECGNSCAGRAALDAFTTLTGWSVF
ncbi:glutaminase [Dactylosporangium sp. NPDC049140]|uniref:glutaminase n=1 Tax=Dactylosporangium sp. NPDC049140 TaxID=3155647 RepID=UPI0033D3323F